ncbi:MAG: hypothetical protein ABIT01_03860 [Thermoanaerobaculia bacterium]
MTASLRDFASRISFRREGKKGSLSVVESGPGAPPSARLKPGPRSEPRISTITHEGPDAYGMVWVSGLVKNSGDAAACLITVDIKLLGPKNQVLGMAKAGTAVERLTPGQSTPFRGAVHLDAPGSIPLETRPAAEVSTYDECP